MIRNAKKRKGLLIPIHRGYMVNQSEFHDVIDKYLKSDEKKNDIKREKGIIVGYAFLNSEKYEQVKEKIERDGYESIEEMLLLRDVRDFERVLGANVKLPDVFTRAKIEEILIEASKGNVRKNDGKVESINHKIWIGGRNLFDVDSETLEKAIENIEKSGYKTINDYIGIML